MKISLTLDFSEKCAALRNTLEFHLSGLIGTASDPDTQKIRIIGFFSEIGYIDGLKFGCYCLHYVPASKPFDHA